MTNREWLNTLTDEEMAEVHKKPCPHTKCPSFTTCKDCWLIWLKAEHEVEDND